jgi:hypothetical protein
MPLLCNPLPNSKADHFESISFDRIDDTSYKKKAERTITNQNPSKKNLQILEVLEMSK